MKAIPMKAIPMKDYILRILRQYRGLDADDSSYDGEYANFTPEQVMRQLVEYEFGDSAWASWFATRIKDTGASVDKLIQG